MRHKCLSCGFEGDIQTGANACTKCGTLLQRVGSSANLHTMLLDEEPPAASTPKSSGVTAAVGAALPKVIDGFEIISQLGYGGMGVVYLAHEPLLDRQVALKLLSRRADEEAHARDAARFLSEAMLTGKLGHAGIVPIYHVGHDTVYGYYYTMRYVKGRTLSDVLYSIAIRDPATCEEFSLTRLLTIFERVCEAIAFAHRHGVVHRDVKPSNVIIGEFGEVLLLDWGIAKQVTPDAGVPEGAEAIVRLRIGEIRKRSTLASQVFLLKASKSSGSRLQQLQSIKKPEPQKSAGMTRDGQILGTPGYLSPEQALGINDVTPASDVYSLGVTLYEVLTGRLPVESMDAQTAVTSTAVGEIVPIQRRPEAARIPKALCEIVSKALSLRPEDRFDSGVELAEELRLYLEGRAPLKRLVYDDFSKENFSTYWTPIVGQSSRDSDGLRLDPRTGVRCNRFSLGDFRCSFHFHAEPSNPAWSVAISIGEVQADKSVRDRYQLQIGVTERPFIELINNGRRVQRRLDVRLQAAQLYQVRVELEQDQLRMWIGDHKYIDYQETFPQTGGAISLLASEGQIYIQQFELQSRGAPLSLSFMALPDRLFRIGRYLEAREFYRQLAASHPDRPEGLIALYKAGLCSTELQDTQTAFGEFSKLEGTMFDQYCALGLAQIGLRDGSIDWAWEALKNGYRRHRLQSMRTEIWFALLSLIESLDDPRSAEKVERYTQLLAELEPEPQESAQVVADLFDVVQRTRGFASMRTHALQLIERFPANLALVSEALSAICRAGVDLDSIAKASQILDNVTKQQHSENALARFSLLRAEILIAQGKMDDASKALRHAITHAGPTSAEGLWARCWQLLLLYTSDQHLQVTTGAMEMAVRLRHYKVNHLSFFHFIEGLSSLARGKTEIATAAFKKAAAFDCMWGWAAMHLPTLHGPAWLKAKSVTCSVNQLVEALFMVSEAHRMLGNEELSTQYLNACLEPERERAMITRLIKERQARHPAKS